MRLHLETQGGCSPAALRGVMQALEAALLEAAGTWEKDACTGEEVRAILGAVDETFLAQMLLGFMDLRTGSRLLAAVAEDRTYATWKAVVAARLLALGARVRYLVSDRAKALIHRGPRVGCLSMPEFLHGMPEVVERLLAIARRVRHARQEGKHAEEVLRAQPHARDNSAPRAHHHQGGAARGGAALGGVQRTYRHHLAVLSLTRHPFHIDDATPQPSAHVHRQLEAAVAASATLAQNPQVLVQHDAMQKVRKQWPALAALVDFWWEGVRQDFAQAALSSPWRRGHRVAPAMGLWGTPSGPHALRAQANQATTDSGGGARCVSPAGAHAAASCAGAGGLAHMGHTAGRGFSAYLLGGGRPQRGSGAPPSHSARVPEAALEGVDGSA